MSMLNRQLLVIITFLIMNYLFFLCERKLGNRSPVNYFISSNELFLGAYDVIL